MSSVKYFGRIPDLIKAHNSMFFFIYPFKEGRLKHFSEEIPIPHETENRIVYRPRGWLFFDEKDIFHNDLVRVDHHLRGVQTGNVIDMQLFIEVMKEMGFKFNNSHDHVPCSSGQKEMLHCKSRPFRKRAVMDFTQEDLLQLHPSRLPLHKDGLIESFWRYAPIEKQPALRKMLSRTA